MRSDSDSASISFYGVRGSVPTPGKATMGIGGNTPCLLIECDDQLIICDCGTGMRVLGDQLLNKYHDGLKATIMPSHLHLDHLTGLPFFNPIYSKKNSFTFIGGFNDGQLEKVLQDLMKAPLFPVSFIKLDSKLNFISPPKATFNIGSINIIPYLCNHPGGSWGWRFNFSNGKSLVHVTDNEPKDQETAEKMIAWMKGADILIHDAQYTPKEYEGLRRGWGHSPYTYPIELAAKAGIPSLYLFHHSPDYDDKKLKGILKDAKAFAKKNHFNVKLLLSYEGLNVVL
ncbi:MAG: MBL fold metallo-hydrolase [Pseudomonadota bacterium]